VFVINQVLLQDNQKLKCFKAYKNVKEEKYLKLKLVYPKPIVSIQSAVGTVMSEPFTSIHSSPTLSPRETSSSVNSIVSAPHGYVIFTVSFLYLDAQIPLCYSCL
jgi:hypothetical protein